jgi:hypothetical protein
VGLAAGTNSVIHGDLLQRGSRGQVCAESSGSIPICTVSMAPVALSVLYRVTQPV